MEFQQRYKDELVNKKELIDQLLKLEKEKKVITLLFSAKDREKNQAMVLIEVLRDKV